MKELVFIVGMHRSGTSMVANLVSEMGYYLGDELIEKDIYNAKGYFENQKVVTLNDAILSEYMMTGWDRVYEESIINLCGDTENDKIVEHILELLQTSFYNKDKIAIKDPRLCITLPIWEKALSKTEYNVKYIYVYRNPMAVAKSIKKRDHKNIDEGQVLWFLYNYYGLKGIGNDAFKTSYEAFITNPEEQIVQLSQYLTGEEKRLGAVVDRQLCNNNQNENEDLLEKCKKLYSVLMSVPDGLLLKDEVNKELFKMFSNYNDGFTTKFTRSQLFLDLGEGFSEDICIIKNQNDRAVETTYDLSGYEILKSLRFDPDHALCSVKLDEVKIVNQQNEIINYSLKTNAEYEAEGKYVFFNDDPQIVFDFEPQKIKSLYIKAQVNGLNSPLLFNLCASFEKKSSEAADLSNQSMNALRSCKYKIYLLKTPLRILRRTLDFFVHPIETINYYKQKIELNRTGNFDVDSYLLQTNDLNVHRGNAKRHYITWGQYNGLKPDKTD